MAPRIPSDPAEVSIRSERDAYAEAIPPGDVTAPCRGSVNVCAYYDDPWKTPVTMAPLRITDMDGVVLDGGARTQGLPSFGMQDGQKIDGVRFELGRFAFNDAKRGPITAELVADPSAADQIDDLSRQILEDLRVFTASMETALQPWILEWEDSGWWGAVKTFFSSAKKGLDSWIEGEGDFWASVWDWASSLPDQIGDAWDSMTATAKALWENRGQLIGLLKSLAEGAVEDFEKGMEALVRLLQAIPGLEEIAETTRLLVQQSAEWVGAMIEMARQKPEVLKALGATALGVVMATTPNFWADMAGMGGGFLLPEIILAIVFALIAFFTGGTGGAALAARLTVFVSKVVTKLRAAGPAGAIIIRMFAAIKSVGGKVVDLVRALKRNVAEAAKGATDAVTNIIRRTPPIPQKARDTVAHVQQTGNAQPGHKGGRTFKNDGRGGGQVLPAADQHGNPITYKEYDVNPYQPGVNRGAERVVIGSDGRAYYTSDHYTTFTPM